jgi:hypothetical protein
MARKITTESVNAFMSARPFSKQNMTVELSPLGQVVVLKLHGNAIARRDIGSNVIEVCNGGWSSNTTKERLNAIPGVSVCQRNFVWYLNGKEWNGGWTFV